MLRRDPVTGDCLEAVLSKTLSHPDIVATIMWKMVHGEVRVHASIVAAEKHTLSRLPRLEVQQLCCISSCTAACSWAVLREQLLGSLLRGSPAAGTSTAMSPCSCLQTTTGSNHCTHFPRGSCLSSPVSDTSPPCAPLAYLPVCLTHPLPWIDDSFPRPPAPPPADVFTPPRVGCRGPSTAC